MYIGKRVFGNCISETVATRKFRRGGWKLAPLSLSIERTQSRFRILAAIARNHPIITQQRNNNHFPKIRCARYSSRNLYSFVSETQPFKSSGKYRVGGKTFVETRASPFENSLADSYSFRRVSPSRKHGARNMKIARGKIDRWREGSHFHGNRKTYSHRRWDI